MKVCCVFSSESPHRGDSKEYTQYTIFSIKMKITLNFPTSATIFFPRDTKRVRNNQGKRAITVQATEVLLYFCRWMMVRLLFKYYGLLSSQDSLEAATLLAGKWQGYFEYQMACQQIQIIHKEQ